MQNIHIKRYSNPESVGWAGTIEPEDRSWVLFVPLDEGGVPELFIEVEAPAEDLSEEQLKAIEDRGEVVPTIKGYAPAIYLDDRVTVKPEVDPPCPTRQD